ncbi:D-alanyl-D-alanine carboxypeptidase [Candidatus Magnetomorum sp. HK-1]|nr:D-alanyl-D-alanine carboxypeptidase [Candidatus Magnetomorum sp. HK-1]
MVLSGFTNEEGEFEYTDNNQITFSIGGIEIGTIQGDDIITVLDMVPGADHTNKTVINIVRFLTSLDSDKDINNGIKIDRYIHDVLSDDTIDFSESNETTYTNRIEYLLDTTFPDGTRDITPLLTASGHLRLSLLMYEPESDIAKTVKEFMDNAITEYDFPGLALVIKNKAGKIYKAASGYADTETKEVMKTDHKIRAASMTKTFTAMLTLYLIQEGKISYDDTVADLLPGVLCEKFTPEITTIRHLLQHSTGLPNFMWDEPGDTGSTDNFLTDYLFRAGTAEFVPQDLIDIVCKFPGIFMSYGTEHSLKIGEAWEYCNAGFILLGMIIEKVTNSKWEDEIRDRIITPLNLTDTIVPETGEVDMPDHSAVGYANYMESFHLCYNSAQDSYYECTEEDNVVKDGSQTEPSTVWSMGNIISSMDDIADWFMYAGESELMSDCKKDLTESEEMFSTGYPGLYMCNGFMRNDTYDILLHPGQLTGYDSAGAYHLGSSSSFAVVTNKTLSHGNIRSIVLFPLLELLFGDNSNDGPSKRSHAKKSLKKNLPGTLSEY